MFLIAHGSEQQMMSLERIQDSIFYRSGSIPIAVKLLPIKGLNLVCLLYTFASILLANFGLLATFWNLKTFRFIENS